MTQLKDIAGQKFGRLTVVAREGSTARGQATWLCRCECGTMVVAVGAMLRNDNTKSCGCLRVDRTVERSTKHGLARRNDTRRAREWNIWNHMKARCYRPSNRVYHNYGGRGITMCGRWRSDFGAFLADMGPCPGPDYSIDRIDNDGNYEPGNCRWATRHTQSRNRRNNIRVSWGGRDYVLWDLAAELGLDYMRLRHLYKVRGVPIEQAVALIAGNTQSAHGSQAPQRAWG